MAGSYERANPEDEEFLHRMIADEIQYVPEDAGEDLGEDDSPSSYLNPSGDGLEVELFNEG